MRCGIGLVLVLMLAAWPACAKDGADPFADAPNGAKLHSASGFICPQQIGHFERDAVGERDPKAGADFCAYSARDGVYGQVTLVPLKGGYDPLALLAPDFAVQKGTGGEMTGETVLTLGTKDAPLKIYTRTYETARLVSMHYRILFASAQVGAWAVVATVEYADPRDADVMNDFLNTVYAEAVAKIAAPPPAPR
jgi:hypothetical protein